jgi:hypothetical protein
MEDRTIVPVFQRPPSAPGEGNPLLPDTDLAFIGIKGSAKSTTMLNMLVRMRYYDLYHISYFCSPHVSPEALARTNERGEFTSDYRILLPLVEAGKVKLYWKFESEEEGNSMQEAIQEAKDDPKHPDKYGLFGADDWAHKLCAQTFLSDAFSNARHTMKVRFW